MADKNAVEGLVTSGFGKVLTYAVAFLLLWWFASWLFGFGPYGESRTGGGYNRPPAQTNGGHRLERGKPGDPGCFTLPNGTLRCPNRWVR